MRSSIWLTGVALLSAASAWAGLKPVAFRLASLPASAEPGQRLMLCATNIGSGELDVSLEFINVKTGGVVAERTVRLAPLGGGAVAQPCLTTTAEAVASGVREALVVGVAMVRKSLLSFREAQVTASIQVAAPDANGVMRAVETIPLSRTAHSADGAPVFAPATAEGGHHK